MLRPMQQKYLFKMTYPYISQIKSFHKGKVVQGAFINALCHGLNYEPFPKGIENSLAGINCILRKAQYSNLVNEETKRNLKYFRKEPDAIVVSPRKNIMTLEVKAYKNINSIDDHLAHNFRFNEMKDIFSFYPHARIVYIDMNNRQISSIYGLEELNNDNQRENWESPWSWIEGIDNKEDYEDWSNKYIFESLLQLSKDFLLGLEPKEEALF